MSVAPFNNSSNKNMTHVPSEADLNALPKDELVRLLKRVTTERDEQARKKLKTAPTAAAAAAAPPLNVPALKKSILKNATRLIKKSKHNRAKKPWTELNENLAPFAVHPTAATELFAGYFPVSDTSRMIKWELSGPQVVEWLGMTAETMFIHPVAFDGKLKCLPGMPPPKVHAWAAVETLQAKYEKTSGRLVLKFHTYLAGTGSPQPGVVEPPMHL